MLNDINASPASPTFWGSVAKDFVGKGVGSWSHAMVTSLTEREAVVEKEDNLNGSITYTAKRKVLAPVDGALEKLANIAQHTCSLSHVGTKLTPILEGACGFIDATRIFSFVDWIFNADKSKDGVFGCGQQLAFGLVGILSTAYTLHEFKIVDFSFVASSIGSVAAYGGFGFVGAIGVVPIIHVAIGVGVVCGIVMTAYKIHDIRQEWTKPDKELNDDNNLTVDDTQQNLWKEKAYTDILYASLGIVGNVAEVALRALSIATGVPVFVIPILGIVSNGIGLLKVVKKTRDENDLTKDVKLNLKEKTINSNVKAKEDPKVAKAVTLGSMITSAFAGTAQIFASTKGMDKFCKFTVAVLQMASPLARGPILMMKAFREAVSVTAVADALSKNPVETGKKVKTVANLFLFAGNLFDTANFLAKANIANLGRFAGNLGQFQVYGIVGRVSLSSLKASCMAVFMALDLYASFAKINESYNKLETFEADGKKETDEYREECQELYIKVLLSSAKIGSIMLSGAFILFAGYSAAAVFTVYQTGVFGADLLNWIRKNVVSKDDDLVFEVLSTSV